MLLQRVQTSSRVHTTSYSMDTGDHYQGIQRSGREFDLLLVSSAKEVKNK